MPEKLKQIRPLAISDLGAGRFLELEQRVGDIENTLELMGELLNLNNASLKTIIDAINRENGFKPHPGDPPKAWGG